LLAFGLGEIAKVARLIQTIPGILQETKRSQQHIIVLLLLLSLGSVFHVHHNSIVIRYYRAQWRSMMKVGRVHEIHDGLMCDKILTFFGIKEDER
jgi:hypothetical protein